jgi:hypothetical protein
MREITGTRDHTYDLVSVLYHLLSQAETFAQYIEDAGRAGDAELAAFFRQLLDEDRHRASYAKVLLLQRLGQASAAPREQSPKQRPSDEVERASMESFPASDAPTHY